MLRRRLVEGKVRALSLRERWGRGTQTKSETCWDERTDNNRRSLCDFTDFFILLHNLLDARLCMKIPISKHVAK